MSKKAPPVRPSGRSRTPFYALLAVIVLVGAAAIWTTTRRPAAPADVFTVDPALVAQAGVNAPSGFLLGNPAAPVRIREFADFECSACMQFATITEPDVRERLVETGQVAFEYFFFPLEMHRNAGAAAYAAACAGEQERFWEMHDAIYQGFNEWALGAARDPYDVFGRYAERIGLDAGKWRQCVEAGTYRDQVLAHKAYGLKLGVNSTPTFVIGDRVVPGALSYDQLKELVDAAAPAAATADAPATTPVGR